MVLKSQVSINMPYPTFIEKYNSRELSELFDSANYFIKQKEIKMYLDTQLTHFNGCILLASNDSVFYCQSKGFSEFSSKTPNCQNTIFELASVSKQFTATAILKLEEYGLLKVTDSISIYFPNFPYPGITIHHLLTHQSGLPEYIDFKNKYWKNSNHLMSNQDLINILYQDHPKALSKPGEKYEYNNTGYVLLASIVSKISKMSFEDFVSEYIFKKVGMNNTFFYTQTISDSDTTTPINKSLIECMAKGYTKNHKERIYDYECGLVGDKGIFSTIHDLYLWHIALKNNIILSQKSYQKMTSKYVESEKNEFYGYGLRNIEYLDGSQDIYHAGLWRGFSSIFYYRPKDDFLWIILSNVFNKAHYNKRNTVLSILDGL